MRDFIDDFSRTDVHARLANDGFDVFFFLGADKADLMVRLPVGSYSVHFLMRKSSNNYIGENT